MMPITNEKVRSVLYLQAASGCPALGAADVKANIQQRSFRCEGDGSRACSYCDLNNKTCRLAVTT